jgi:hypothetical protein
MYRHAWIFPTASFLVSCIGIVIVYIMAVHRDHVAAFFPYISEAGSTPPESCVFGLILTIGSAFYVTCIYIRHRQIVSYYGYTLDRQGKCWHNISRAMMVLGFISVFGIIIVANFQASNVLSVHMTGALMAFGVGLLYAWTQTIFGYVMKPSMVARAVHHIRLVLCILGAVFFITMEASGFSEYKPATYRPENSNTTTNLPFGHWPSYVPGYDRHIIATICEWLMVLMFQLYILTFAIEFRHISIEPMRVRLPATLPTTEKQKPIKVTYRTNSVVPIADAGVSSRFSKDGDYVIN